MVPPGRADLPAQLRGRPLALERELRGAEDGLEGETVGRRARQPHALARRAERLEQQEDVGGAASREPRDRVELLLGGRHPDACPTPSKSCVAPGRGPPGLTAALPHSAVAPARTSAGVFGIARTIRARAGSERASRASGTPAAIEIQSGRRLRGAARERRPARPRPRPA